MTTIAWRDGILAVDRQITSSDFGEAADYKLALLPNREVAIAICGNMDIGLLFIDWYGKYVKDKEEKFSVDCIGGSPYYCAVVVKVIAEAPSAFELAWWGNAKFPIPRNPDEYYAEGRGSEAATGAMYCGADAIMAVRAANHHCIHSGYGILSVDMNKATRKIVKHT